MDTTRRRRTLAELVADLVEPSDHREVIERRDPIAHRRRGVTIHTRHPSLLDQIRTYLVPSVQMRDDRHGTGYTSVMAATTNALDLLMRIEHGARDLVVKAGATPRDAAEANLRAAVGLYPGDPEAPETRRVAGWRAAALVVAQWTAGARHIPNVPCPVCAGPELRIVADPPAGWCSSCGTSWDETEVGILGEHVRSYRAPRQEAG